MQWAVSRPDSFSHYSFLKLLCLLIVVSLLASCSKSQTTKADFSTPEGAILMLEDAYRHKDIEAAVFAKDFDQDAFYFLGLEFGTDWGKTNKMAAVMETNFRRQMTEEGFPDYTSIKSSFLKREVVSPDQVIVTERCEQDGTQRDMRLLVVQTQRGWRTVLAPGFDTK
jgi:hypothetical protein